MAIDLVKNLISGRGAPRLGSKGGKGAPKLGAYTAPPPFIGNWPNGRIGRGLKKTSKKGKGLLLGKNSPFNSIPLIGAIL